MQTTLTDLLHHEYKESAIDRLMTVPWYKRDDEPESWKASHGDFWICGYRDSGASQYGNKYQGQAFAGWIKYRDSFRLLDARKQGEHAMHAVAENSGADFQNRAYDLARAFFQKAERATGEDATDYVVAQGCVPHDRKAFGNVYRRLIQDGVIERVGYMPRRCGHGSPGPVYEARL